MNFLLNTIKLVIFSNLLVSLCVAAYTHLTYLLFDLSTDTSLEVSLMVFCFTFTTYNGQRIFRLKKYHNLGERLQWVVSNKLILTLLSLLLGAVGLILMFRLSTNTIWLLIPMGIISFFYVVPIPLINKGIRNIPFIKVFVIALVWSCIIVGIPFLNAKALKELDTTFALALVSCFCFIVSITLPFDIRDINYDEREKLKTIPQLLGIKGTILTSLIFLVASGVVLFLGINSASHGIYYGYIATMVILVLTNKNRKELFYAGWVESTVIMLWLGEIIGRYLLL